MRTPIRVGVLGLGQRGLQHLRQLWRLQDEGLVQVTALADAFPANLDASKLRSYVPGFSADNLTFTTDVDALLDGRLDALYVCIPPNVHRGEVVRAAQAGIHLFVEKPMSLYLDEAIEMQAAIDAAGVLAAVGFQQRYDPRYEAIRQFLACKHVVMANYLFHAPIESHNIKHTPTDALGGPPNRVWTASRAWSGTTLVEAGIHPLDLWRSWFGDVAWVQASYVQRPPDEIFDGADNPYAYAVTFGFACGAIGSMMLSRLRRVFRSEYHHIVLWNEGHLCLEDGAVAVYHYDGPYPPGPQGEPTAESDLRRVLPVERGPGADYAISRAFLEAIATGSPGSIRSPFADAMNSLAAVLAANVSDALGGARVDLKELLAGEAYAAFRRRGG